jgi:hypothetical protein
MANKRARSYTSSRASGSQIMLSSPAEKITQGRCLCGAVEWTLRGDIPDATICNCTACRRYGVLWAYGYDGVDVHVKAPKDGLTAYMREDGGSLTFNFCRTCGNLITWRGTEAGEDGRTRIAVNLRLSAPEDVAAIPLKRFEGLRAFNDLPNDGRCVSDVWF